MTEQLDSFLLDPLDEFFAAITADPQVRSFGWDPDSSKIFRTYDGNALPIVSNGTIVATSLPALYLSELVPSHVEDDTTPDTVVVQIAFELRVVFSNSASFEAFPAIRCMSALLALLGAIKNERNRIHGISESIDSFDVAMQELVPIREADGSGRILYWDGGLSVELRRNWTVPQE